MAPPKYSFEQVERVRQLLTQGKTLKEIQAEVPMSFTRISHIKHGARKKR